MSLINQPEGHTSGEVTPGDRVLSEVIYDWYPVGAITLRN
jgi:hypothetical protein